MSEKIVQTAGRDSLGVTKEEIAAINRSYWSMDSDGDGLAGTVCPFYAAV